MVCLLCRLPSKIQIRHRFPSVGDSEHRFKRDGEIKINDNALVTLALFVAQSDPQEKELMVKLITQLINSR